MHIQVIRISLTKIYFLQKYIGKTSRYKVIKYISKTSRTGYFEIQM